MGLALSRQLPVRRLFQLAALQYTQQDFDRHSSPPPFSPALRSHISNVYLMTSVKLSGRQRTRYTAILKFSLQLSMSKMVMFPNQLKPCPGYRCFCLMSDDCVNLLKQAGARAFSFYDICATYPWGSGRPFDNQSKAAEGGNK